MGRLGSTPIPAHITPTGYYQGQDKWTHVQRVNKFADINDAYDQLLEKEPSNEELIAWEKSVEEQFVS